jgi:hypothetical protein
VADVERSYTFRDLIDIIRRVVAAFDAAERRPWSVEVVVMELAKQVGDLARRVLVAERYYLPDRDQRAEYTADAQDIGDELADILYCLIRIDLEEAHLRARRSDNNSGSDVVVSDGPTAHGIGRRAIRNYVQLRRR